MEAERLVVAEFTATEHQRETAQPDILTVHSDATSRETKGKTKGKKKSKPRSVSSLK